MRRNYASQNGSAIVESAIILPLLLIIIFGIIEFGILFYDKQIVTNASREGARAGVVLSANRLPETGTPSITSVVNSYCANHLITFGNNPNLHTSAVVSGSHSTTGTATFGDTLTVTVNYTYSFLVFPNILNSFFGSHFSNLLILTAVTQMNYE